MNYDISTEQGMLNSVRWMKSLMAVSSPKFIWAIPRSSAVYQIDTIGKTFYPLASGGEDKSTNKVLAHMGFTRITQEHVC